MSRAAGLSKCPVGRCTEKPEPWFCPTHWPLVSSEIRRRIIRIAKELNGDGVGDPPQSLLQLLAEGVREAVHHD